MSATPPPKFAGARHSQAKHCAPTATTDQQQHPQPGQRRQRRNNTNTQHDASQQPAWQDANVPVHASTGFFDTNGNYVEDMPLQDQQRTNEEHTKAKKKAQRQRANNSDMNSYTTAQHRTQSPRNYSQPSAQIQAPTHATDGTPAKMAYAGPTFHASPAPSKLPVPKFFQSKSVPAEASASPMQARLDNESDKSDNSQSPDTSDATLAKSEMPQKEESPLDLFFNADREEKRKSASKLLTPDEKFSHSSFFNSEPPPASDWNSIYGPAQRNHIRHHSGTSRKEMFMMELDGNNARQPQKEHERPVDTRSATAPSHLTHANAQDRSCQSQSLKNILASLPQHGSPVQGPRSPNSHSPGYASDQRNGSPFYRPVQSPRSVSGPNTPAPSETDTQIQNALHYGSKQNLTPMFKGAAKTDSVMRASSLRQEIKSSPTSQQGKFEAPSPSQNRQCYNHSEFPRKYLESLSAAGSVPQLPLPASGAGNKSSSSPDQPSSASPFSRASMFSSSPSVTTPRNSDGLPLQAPAFPKSHQPPNLATARSPNFGSSAVDKRALEDDLRRMLNINNLGGSTTGVR